MERGPFPSSNERTFGREWALLQLDRPLLSLPGAVLISTKLDVDQEASGSSCRIMFCGNLVHIFQPAEAHKQLRIYTVRTTLTHLWQPGSLYILPLQVLAPWQSHMCGRRCHCNTHR
jgi:hypothetical protein